MHKGVLIGNCSVRSLNRWDATYTSVVVNVQGELSERHSVASESGSSTDSHAETSDSKDGESLSYEMLRQLGCCHGDLTLPLLPPQ